jgi:hypothetical protein
MSQASAKAWSDAQNADVINPPTGKDAIVDLK